MRYLSVCSGIEAATCAWHPLGWQPVGFSEIEKFPSAVLAHHYPDVPNLGDMTKFLEWPDDLAPDLIVGGTPCQSFSVAGLRRGLADPRGNLVLVYLAMADRYRPEWLVWENVPGVLSSNGGRDFGAILGGLVELGYGFAYRVLDAQFFGVAQRRRRVFVVGYLGDWRRAAAVLFERDGLSGNPAPRRESRKDIAPTISARTSGGGGLGTDFDLDGGLIARPTADLIGCLNSAGGHAVPGNTVQDASAHQLIPMLARCVTTGEGKRQDWETCTIIPATAHTLRAEGFDASEDGTGRGTPLVPVAFAHQAGGIQTTLGYDPEVGTAPTLAKCQTPAIHTGMAVRRLTPVECERLQGFPDGYTDIGKPGNLHSQLHGKQTPDGPRYKALGNSMAVPVMAWIGKRIAAVSEQQLRAAA